MDRYQFRNSALTKVRPYRLELRAIGKPLSEFNSRVGTRVRALHNQFAILDTGNRLLLHYTSFLKTLDGMLTDEIFLLGNQASDSCRKFSLHGFVSLQHKAAILVGSPGL